MQLMYDSLVEIAASTLHSIAKHQTVFFVLFVRHCINF